MRGKVFYSCGSYPKQHYFRFIKTTKNIEKCTGKNILPNKYNHDLQ